MTSSLVISKQIIGAQFSTLFSAIFLCLMFLNIQIDWIILKTYDQQFTLTTKKSLHIICKVSRPVSVRDVSRPVFDGLGLGLEDSGLVNIPAGSAFLTKNRLVFALPCVGVAW